MAEHGNGHLLEVQRICAGLSREELSRRAVAARTAACRLPNESKLSPHSIELIEAGKAKPSLFQLRWFAKGLGCNLADLLTRSQCVRIVENAEVIPEEETRG